jgi:hypothetical protein
LSEISVIQERINAQFPPNKHDVSLRALTDVMLGDTRPVLQVLLAAVGLILLIACANVANLLLARGTGRAKEFAVREALGAQRWRMVRQSLTESALLAAAALLSAGLLTRWVSELLLRFWPENLKTPEVVLDWRVAAFAASISVAAVMLFGLAPALLVSRTNLNLAMKEGSQRTTDSSGHGRLRAVFVVSEVALALVLMIGSLLTLRSFNRLLHIDPGFNPEKLLTARVALPESRYPEAVLPGVALSRPQPAGRAVRVRLRLRSAGRRRTDRRFPGRGPSVAGESRPLRRGAFRYHRLFPDFADSAAPGTLLRGNRSRRRAQSRHGE